MKTKSQRNTSPSKRSRDFRKLLSEQLEPRTLLAVTPLDFSDAAISAIVTPLDQSFESGENNTGGLNVKLPFFDTSLDEQFQLKRVIESTIQSAKDSLNNAAAATIETALAQLAPQTGGVVSATLISISADKNTLVVDVSLNTPTVTTKLAIDNTIDVTGLGLSFDFNAAQLPEITVENSVQGVIRLRVQKTGGTLDVTAVPGDGTQPITKLSYLAKVSSTKANISGNVASQISYDGSVSFSMQPRFDLTFGVGSTPVQLSDLASRVSGGLVSGTDVLQVPLSIKITSGILPNVEYSTVLRVSIKDPGSIINTSDSVPTSVAQLRASLVSKAAGPLLERIGSFVPDEVKDFLLGRTPAFGGKTIGDVISLITAVLAESNPANPQIIKDEIRNVKTPIDLIGAFFKYFPGTQGLAPAVEIAKTILNAQDAATAVTQLNLNESNGDEKKAQVDGKMAELKELGFTFPFLDSPTQAVFSLITKKPTDLVRWDMDIVQKIAEIYKIPVKEIAAKLKEVGADSLISIEPSAVSALRGRVKVVIDPANFLDFLLAKLPSSVADNVKKVFEKLNVSKALDIKGSFELESGITAVVDSSFIVNGFTARSLADSFSLLSPNLFDFKFDLKASTSIPASSKSAGLVSGSNEGLALAFGYSPPDITPRVGGVVGELGKDASDAGKHAGDVIASEAEKAGKWIGDKLVRVELAGGITGTFNLSLANPSPPKGNSDGKLQASEALDILKTNPLCLVFAKGNINASASATGVLLGRKFDKSVSGTLINFASSSCVGVDGTGTVDIESEPRPFAQLKDGVLTVFDNSEDGVFVIRNSADGKTVEVQRGGATVSSDKVGSFLVANVREIVVVLDGSQTSDPTHTRFESSNGGNDRVEISSNLKSVPVKVLGGTGNDFISANFEQSHFRGNFTVFGGLGNDTILGGAGKNELHGGLGNDVLYAGPAESNLFGEDNDDLLSGVPNDSGVTQSSFGGVFIGGGGDDVLTVGKVSTGRFTLIGGSQESGVSAGNNVIYGGVGDETLVAGNVDKSFVPDLNSTGVSRLFGGGGNDRLFGDGIGDTLVGGGVDTEVYSGVDSLFGGSGDDVLSLGNITFTATGFVVPEESNQHLGAGNAEVGVGGAGVDTFVIGNNDSEVSLNGNSENDLFLVSSNPTELDGTTDFIRGNVNIDAGGGDSNLLFVNDIDGDGNDSVKVDEDSIRGIAPATIFFRSTGGGFLSDGVIGGIQINGSDRAVDDILVEGLIAINSLIVSGNGRNDRFSVGARSGDDNGDLDRIAGVLSIFGQDGDDKLYVNDHGVSGAFNYRLFSSRIANDLKRNGKSRTFAGIDFDTTMESVRLDGTDDPNVFSILPSDTTDFFVDGNIPESTADAGKGRDYLFIEKQLAESWEIISPRVTFTTILDGRQREGTFGFSQDLKNIGFSSIERFNLLDKLTQSSDAAWVANAGVGVTSPLINSSYSDLVTNFTSSNLVPFSPAEFPSPAIVGKDVFSNLLLPSDVNNDGNVSPLDALVVINHLNRRSGRGSGSSSGFLDVNNDGNISPLDAIIVINTLNRGARPTVTYGGVRTTSADLNFDGVEEVIAVSGANHVPTLLVFNGVTGQLMGSPHPLTATTDNFGTNVTAGDIDGDGSVEIITSSDRGSGTYSIWRWEKGLLSKIADRTVAFSAGYLGGIRVATGDLNGDGKSEIIVGSGTGTDASVRAYDANGVQLYNFLVAPSFGRGGVYVASGDYNGDGRADLFVSSGRRGNSQIQVFDGVATLGNSIASSRLISNVYTGQDAIAPISIALKDSDGDEEKELYSSQLSDGKSDQLKKWEYSKAADAFFSSLQSDLDPDWSSGAYLG